jgi:hypothetical protein
MLKQNIDAFLATIPVIKEINNHWFFRTMGGKLYQPFLEIEKPNDIAELLNSVNQRNQNDQKD